MSRARDLSRLSNSQAFSVDSNFNVGINTDNPQVELDVSGNANISGNISVGGTITYDDVTNIDSIGIITARSDVSIADRIIHTGDTDTTIRFPADDTITGETAGFERVRIDSSGNVGIGQTSPVAPIDITTANGRFLVREDQSDLCLDSVTTSNDAFENLRIRGTNLIFQNGGDERMRIDSSGRVGIGTTSPGDYSGATTQLSIAASGSSGLNIVSGTTSTGIIRFADGTSGDAAYRGRVEYMHDIDALMFGTAGSERLRITSDGKLGVGTSAPGALLNLAGTNTASARNVVLRFNDTDSTVADGDIAGAIEFYSNDGGTSAETLILEARYNGTGGSSDLFIRTGDKGSLSDDFVFTNGGRLGIGTTSPTQKLHIYDTNNAYLQLTTAGSTQSASGGFQLIHNGAGDLRANIVQRENAPMTFLTNDTERMRIDSSGRLLVGTSSALATYASQVGQFQVAQTSTVPNTSLFRFTGDAGGPNLYFSKSRGTSIGTNTVVQANDAFGSIQFAGADGSGYSLGASISANVDGTPGANDMPGRLVFSTTADGASSPTERMRIRSNGNISTSGGLAIGDVNIDTTYFFIGNLQSGAGNSTLKWNTSTGFVTYDTSSRLVKENIQDCSYGIDSIKALKPRKYFRVDDQREEIGFIADELVKVMPEFVPIGPKSVITKNEKDTEDIPIGVNYEKLTAVLTKALQEAIGKIEVLEQRLADAGIA